MEQMLREKAQRFIGLEVTGEHIEGVTIHRQHSTVYLKISSVVIARASNVYSVTGLVNDYEMLTGDTITYEMLDALTEGVPRISPREDNTRFNILYDRGQK
jgi:hypothetical protein